MIRAKTFLEVMDKLETHVMLGLEGAAYNINRLINFYKQPFDIKMLINFEGIKPDKEADAMSKIMWNKAEGEVLFDGWKRDWKNDAATHLSDMNNVQNRIIIPIEETHSYTLHCGGHGRRIISLMPKTLDDFIRDCQRIGISLIWKKEIAEKYNFKPQENVNN